MSSANTPSPPPRPVFPTESQTLPHNSSILSAPIFESTLPLPRPASALSAFRQSLLSKNGRVASSQRRGRTRSGASSLSRSSDGSLGEFSMENYTIDIAQLGRKEGGARPVGYEEAFQGRPRSSEDLPYRQEDRLVDDIDSGENDDDENDENESNQDLGSEDEDNDFMAGYEIDLGGLGEKPGSLVVEDVIRQQDEVPSDDDGPEDFTQNMEAWMRGKRRWEKEQDDDIAEGHEPDPDPEQDLREVIADHGLVEESTFEPIGTSTPAPLKSHAIIVKGVEKEGKMQQPPPLSRLNTEMMQDRAAEEVFDRISALQAEVEQMRQEDEIHRANYRALEQEHEQMREEYRAFQNQQQDRYDALREQHERLERDSASTKYSLQRDKDDLSRNYNDAMGRLRNLESDSSTDRGVEDEIAKSKYKEVAEELEIIKAHAETDQVAADTKIQRIQDTLQVSRDECSRLQAQIESIQQSHNLEVSELKIDLDARRKEVALERKESVDRANEAASLAESVTEKDKEIHELTSDVKASKIELDYALQQLAETRRIVDTVEDENDRLVQQVERKAQDITELQALIASKDDRGPEVVPIDQQHVNFIDDETHKAALEALTQQHEITLSSLAADHGKETQILRDALLKAGQGMQKREEKATEAHKDQITSLEQQITSLKEQLAKPSPPSPKDTETELRSAIRTLNSKLEKANATVETSRAEVETARQEAEDAQRTNAVVNVELEARFADAVEAREKEWRRRMDLLFKERDKMSKALMWGWGREEVGAKAVTEREQGYRYRFVRRA